MPSTSIASVCGSTNIPPLRPAAARRGGIATADRTVETPAGARRDPPVQSRRDAATLDLRPWRRMGHGRHRSHDHIARWLAAETGSRVLQIEYSLAPEHPYPAAMNEIDGRPLRHACRGEGCAGPGRRAILAGANLAASAILRLSKDERRRIAGFVSIYGAYAPEMNLSSHRLYGDGRFGLSEAQMRWFWNLYAPQLRRRGPGQATQSAVRRLVGFSADPCIGAECDLLLDDTLAFYGELTKAGVDVSLSLWSSLPHGCMHFVGAVGSVTEAAGSIVQFVNARGRAAGGAFSRCTRVPSVRPDREPARTISGRTARSAMRPRWSMSSRCSRPVAPGFMARSPIGWPATSSRATSRRDRCCPERRAPASRSASRAAPIARRSAPSRPRAS